MDRSSRRSRPSRKEMTMPKFLLQIYGDDSPEVIASATPEQQQQIMDAYNAFTQSIKDDGSHLGGEALQPAATAKVVRVTEGGETVVTDGPFAETKEQLGGYYLVDAPHAHSAAKIAARI